MAAFQNLPAAACKAFMSQMLSRSRDPRRTDRECHTDLGLKAGVGVVADAFGSFGSAPVLGAGIGEPAMTLADQTIELCAKDCRVVRDHRMGTPPECGIKAPPTARAITEDARPVCDPVDRS